MASESAPASAPSPPESGEEVNSRIQVALEKTKEALAEVQKQVNDYDEKYQASASVKAANEKASEYLKKAMEDAKVAVEDLTVKTQILRDASAEIPVKALSRAIAAVGGALEQVKELAKKYDEKYQVSTKVLDAVTPAREQCMKYLGEVSHYTTSAAAAANAQLNGVNDGLKSKIKEFSSSSAHYLINVAAGLDKKHDISSLIHNTVQQLDEKYKIASKAKELDEKYNIQVKTDEIIEKAKAKGKELDEKYTSGKYTPLVANAYNDGLKMVTEGLERLQTEFEEAKQSQGDENGKEKEGAASN